MKAGWRWQDEAAASSNLLDEKHLVRRVWGENEIRFDGLSDLLLRSHGASIFDVGCNRGHVGWDFAMNGARLVHGCDIHGPSIHCARMWFSEHPYIESKFEIVDLTRGPKAIIEAFGTLKYDVVLFLGVQHKLKKVMMIQSLDELVAHLATRALVYFAWTGYEDDIKQIDQAVASVRFRRMHTSEFAKPGHLAAVWKLK